MNLSSIKIGNVEVRTNGASQYTPEFIAQRMVERIIHVSEGAPPEIRSQALAFKDQVYALILSSATQIVTAERERISRNLDVAGMAEAAVMVRTMEK